MPQPSLNRDVLAVCEAQLNHGSRSFYAAGRLLPADVRDAATALYAFCRMADDEIDVEGRSPDSIRRRIEAAVEGRPLPRAEDQALAWVIERYQIPLTVLDSLIEGFEWDVGDKVYETVNDVYAYGARVAGTVGVMMALIMGRRDAESLARACDLGVAMQLTNIARDVGEDARAGRIYLPAQWLDEEGVPASALGTNPCFSPGLGRVVERLLDAADTLYLQADSGLAALPRACRPSMFAARYLYASIGKQVRANGCNSIDQRAFVGRKQKLRLLGVALRAALVSRRSLRAIPELAETQYLVEAVKLHPVKEHAPMNLGGQMEWLFDTCIRLEIEEREQREERLMGRVGSPGTA